MLVKDLKKATILFSVPLGVQWHIFSFLIRFFQFKKTLKPFKFFGLYHSSHVAIKIDDQVFEAVLWLGVRKIPYGEWLKVNSVKKQVAIWLTDKKFKEGNIFLEASCGIPYAFVELFGMLWQRILKTFFNKEIFTNPIKTRVNKYKCSELVYRYFLVTQYVWGLEDPNLVDVCDIEEIIS